MRPAGGDRRSPQEVKYRHMEVRENTGVVPLSVEVEEFSLRTVLKNRFPIGEGSDGSGNCVPVVSITAVAGAASPDDFAVDDEGAP